MAGHNKYDPKLDWLVVETRTFWDPEIDAELSAEDKAWLEEELHREPQKAAKISYNRSHTGFTREITVTAADIERLYQERAGA